MAQIDIETSATYTNRTTMFFSSNEGKWCRKILKWKEDHPDDVEIIAYPEKNDGMIYAKLPVSWFKIAPKITRNLSDEQRHELAEKMKNNFSKLSNSSD